MHPKARRKLLAGTSGTGSPAHLGLEMLRRASGSATNFCIQKYRGGAPAAMDLVAGNIDVLFSNLPECIGYLREKRLRGLAVTARIPEPLLKDTPVLRDIPVAGEEFPQLVIKNWTAMLTRGNVAPAIRQKIERDTREVLMDPDLKRRVEHAGFQVLRSDAISSASYIDEQIRIWKDRFPSGGNKTEWASQCD